jgi:NADH dehydrogenase
MGSHGRAQYERYDSSDLAAKVLLLGSTGFLGRAVAHSLLDAGYEVRALVRDHSKAAALRARGAELMGGDATSSESLAAACTGCVAVVSLVAVRRDRPQTFLEVNIEAPRRLGEAALAAGVKKVVFVSAVGARPDPKLRYLVSRWAGEEALKRTGVPYTILRFSFILGQDGGVVDDFERAANVGPVIVIPGDGQSRFQPIIRDDAAHCIVTAIGRDDLTGTSVDLGGPEILTYEQMFGFFTQARGIKKPQVNVPVQLLKPGAAVMELLMPNPIVTTDELRTLAIENIAGSLDVVNSTFGFRPSSPSAWAPVNWKVKSAGR